MTISSSKYAFIKLIYLVFCSLLICSCNDQVKFYKIDKSIENDLAKNKKADGTSRFGVENLSYFIFSNNQIETMTSDTKLSDFDLKRMIDTTKTLIPNVCHCQLKNDTIKILGGIFYGGGIGYELKMTKNKFDGKIVLASGSKTYKKTIDGELMKELNLSSEHQDIQFYDEPEFKLDSYLKGKIVLTSEEYFTKSSDELEKDKTMMKILFKCKLSKHEGF